MKAGVAMLVVMWAGLASCTHPSLTPAERGEARLARMIADRVPGEPRSCITVLTDSRLKVIDRTAVVYDGGEVVWVARPSVPRALGPSDILVIERDGSQLCRQDVIRTVDRHEGFTTGPVFLGDFVPYRKPEAR